LSGASHNIQDSFDQFWNDKISKPISKLVKLSDEDYDFQSVYKRLHDYACDPDNFWPQIRDRIKDIPSTFEEIKSSGKLIWVDSVAFVSDIPGKNDDDRDMWGGSITTSTLIELVKQAQIEILIQSPYLVTSDLSLSLFKDAVRRGVKIKILTNSFISTESFNIIGR
jgi:phosphatidylserine/phosphatidylglycerophosphate/cardiolipin synthase-like enzyme